MTRRAEFDAAAPKGWPKLAASLACLCAAAFGASAADVTVLSAGAVEPGVRPVIEAFEKASGHTVTLAFATAPQIRQRIESGAHVDVLIAPPGLLDDLARSGKAPAGEAPRVALGRVGVGVAVRPGAPLPDIGTVDALKRSVIDADSVVFNRASTGLHLEGVWKQLGIDAAVNAKATRYPDGASVLEHLLRGSGREIGFGAITEIKLLQGKGLVFVGPLPAAIQNHTLYAAVAVRGDAAPVAARELLAHLASAPAQSGFATAGITPGP